MGKDKFENEDLIKYGIPEDIWFHVDDLSSAHVYLRLPKGTQLDDIPMSIIMSMCQLVKANSIEGCKKKEVYVVYTRWRNLLKTADMEPGQVSFHDKNKVRRIKVTKDTSVVNKLNKTKREEFPDLAALQEARALEVGSFKQFLSRKPHFRTFPKSVYLSFFLYFNPSVNLKTYIYLSIYPAIY